MKSVLLSVLLSCCCLISGILSAQEALVSETELYYDFLSLQGLSKRPYLNYRTLSDSKWAVTGDSHPWQNNNLGKKHSLTDAVSLRIYGPELFASFNSAAPFGQNDGVLWQGKGLNAALTGGARVEGYGAELTFKPQLSFSQNLAYEIMQSAYTSEYGYIWSYELNRGIDLPQRFGDKPLYLFDWGDTEIRYTWKNLTAGFGTQAIWLGPAYINPMLHSNNAPTYPKADLGLRRQPVTIPWLNWYIGDVEARFWVGQLAESGYFDNDASNNYTMIHGLSFAYAPPVPGGLTLFFNRTCLVPWSWSNLRYILISDANTIEDQKVSLGASWLFPRAGLEIYGELGVDDTGSISPENLLGMLRYPFHTMIYSVGLKKSLNISREKDIYGELVFEWNNSEMSMDYQFRFPYSFYFHTDIRHGYTNKGQLIGSGNGAGGNSQYLEFKLYYPRGNSSVLFHRSNPDNNYIYQFAIDNPANNNALSQLYFRRYKTSLTFGGTSSYFVTSSLNITGKLFYNLIMNPNYDYTPETNEFILLHNMVIQLLLRYSF